MSASYDLLYRLLDLVERKAAYARGKGYGTATMASEVAQIRRLLKGRPALAIDVGGNIGDYAAELRRCEPLLEIHVFEPSATNVAKLSVRFRFDSRIRINPVALSDTASEATLFSNKPGSGLGSLTQRKLDHFNIRFDTKETVKMVRFEDYWRHELDARQVDIVKLDVEGHELSALKGFGEAIAATRVIQFEFGGGNIDTKTYFQDFWYFFAERDFDLYRITPLGVERINVYRERDEFFSTTNYIAVNRRVSLGVHG